MAKLGKGLTVKLGITTKNLIDVGVFTVLYIVVVGVFGQLGALIPILQVLGPFYIPALAGVVFMLFLTRVDRFGMVSLFGVLVGLLVLATGQSYWVPVLAVFLAPLADFIFKLGGYKSWPHTVLGYLVFSQMLIGMVVPLFFARESFLAKISGRHDAAWVQTLVDLTPNWMFAVMIAELALGAVVGAYVGRALLRKHFERAGIG
ncbi:MAG: MptD family putative ECF transporter S component [Propionibacteriaceae bacterium]|nr:MptD family putative ECF transporter S component [Propionibacteriaceae bacterium]